MGQWAKSGSAILEAIRVCRPYKRTSAYNETQFLPFDIAITGIDGPRLENFDPFWRPLFKAFFLPKLLNIYGLVTARILFATGLSSSKEMSSFGEPSPLAQVGVFSIDANRYLGKGSYGRVYIGKNVPTNEEVAVKWFFPYQGEISYC